MAGRPEKDKGTYGDTKTGGSTGKGGAFADAFDTMAGSVGIKNGGYSPNKSKGTGKEKLPPGLNPLKYQANPTQQFKPTAGNLLKGATLVGDVLSGPVAIGLEAVKSELGLSPVDNMLDPFKDRMPDTTGGDFDKSENVNQSIGQTNSTMGPDATASAIGTAEQKKKKRIAEKPGFNLLTGAGGTLLGT